MKSIKTWQTIARLFLLLGLGLWILTTVIFLCVYGWHWTATEPIEKTCDFIVTWVIVAGMVSYWLAGTKVVDEICEQRYRFTKDVVKLQSALTAFSLMDPTTVKALIKGTKTGCLTINNVLDLTMIEDTIHLSYRDEE